MGHTPVPSIEVNRVGRGEPIHPAAEVGSMNLGDQMVVIAHQNISVRRDVVTIERFDNQLHNFAQSASSAKILCLALPRPVK